MISFKPLFETMRKKGITSYTLTKKDNVIGPGTYAKLKENAQGVSVKTISDLCKYMNCKVKDIIEYIPDTDNNTDNEP